MTDPQAPVDVAEVRRRVHAAGRETRAEATMTSEKAREVLRDRARELAAMRIEQRDEARIDVIVFTLAGERYAVETRGVIEVFRLADLTTLPGAEQPVLGLTAWRGRLLMVLDLRAALGVPTSALNDLAYVIVLGSDRAPFGVLADTVDDSRAIPLAEVHAPPAGLGARRGALRGVTADTVMVVDADFLTRELGDFSHGESTE